MQQITVCLYTMQILNGLDLLHSKTEVQEIIISHCFIRITHIVKYCRLTEQE